MKKSIQSFVAILAFTFSMTVISCGGESKNEEQTLPPVEINKDSTQVQASAYHCPMDCEKGNSDSPGKCGDCEMELVARK